jgi:mercuric ion binding protein
MMKITALAGLMVGIMLTSAQAGEVSIKGVHICCGMCVKAIDGVLGKVDGVSDAKCDKDSKTVTFTATDEKSAKAGVLAIRNAGFYGNHKLDGKRLALFSDKNKNKNKGKNKKADKKSNEITLYRVHLCCGGCVNAVDAALKGIDGVAAVKCDREAKSVKLTGKDISNRAVTQALHKAGFNGSTRKPRAKKKKKNS